MRQVVEEIIHQVPGWKDEDNFQIEPLEGLTNTNYSVTIDKTTFVVRVSRQNSSMLGINRAHEYEILKQVSSAGIGALIKHFILPEGHLVTYKIDGKHLTLEEYRTPKTIQRIVKTVKKLHALPLPKIAFSPFERVKNYALQARSMNVRFPLDFDVFAYRMDLIKQEQERDPYPWQGLCHNDLFFVNVLDDGRIRFIDWEFAGAGDIYYDLATLTYAYDSLDTLPRELQEYVLACYFGEVKKENWVRLEGMKYMLLFFTAMWGLLQEGMRNEGLIPAVEGFDFLKYSAVTFESMRKILKFS